MSIGTNIKKRRYELNMSQDELAHAMGYKTRSTIAKIESGENGVSTNKLKIFAQVLDTTPEALISISDEKLFSRISLTDPEINKGTNNIVVILAGGKSTRNQQNIPNQFITVLGKPVIIYSMEAYEKHPAIKEIYVVCLKGWEDILLSYAEQFHINKLAGIIPAGESGILSIRNSVEHVNGKLSNEDIIIFQESTRPMVTEEMISKLLHSCKENGSAITSEPMNNYVQFFLDVDRVRYLNRNLIIEGQTPEGYKYGDIYQAFSVANLRNKKFDETCAFMFMYNMGYPLKFYEGNHNNLKIVRQEDIAIFTALLKSRQ